MISKDWGRRLGRWRETMPRLFYRELGPVELQGFCTMEHITPEQAEKQKFRPMPAGTAWGAKWEYAWFRGEVVVPRTAKGERLALRLDTGGESAIFVNGIATGAKGWSDRAITLTRSAKGGEQFHILVESYGGHGP